VLKMMWICAESTSEPEPAEPSFVPFRGSGMRLDGKAGSSSSAPSPPSTSAGGFHMLNVQHCAFLYALDRCCLQFQAHVACIVLTCYCCYDGSWMRLLSGSDQMQCLSAKYCAAIGNSAVGRLDTCKRCVQQSLDQTLTCPVQLS